MYVCTYIHTHIYIHTYMHTCIHAYTHTHILTYACIEREYRLREYGTDVQVFFSSSMPFAPELTSVSYRSFLCASPLPPCRPSPPLPYASSPYRSFLYASPPSPYASPPHASSSRHYASTRHCASPRCARRSSNGKCGLGQFVGLCCGGGGGDNAAPRGHAQNNKSLWC